ncbi:MAG: cadherin-like beta sandwich domain-containing protein, partial [Paludibacteraceae bacterium]|nr:cadherin-like beta sandwich domain-containing protein [Paludibacteraceae bacterium]
MKNFYSFFTFLFLLVSVSAFAQQLPNNQFEDWSGPKYDGNEQPASWNYCNVTQAGFSFNFAHKESGRSGYCMMVQDQDLEVMGIGETSPGYVSLGRPWVYLEGLNVKGASAGTEGGISWNYRPDTMAVWIKRTGSNAMSEDFHLLYYAWSGTAYSNVYKSKDGNCASTGRTDEESDIRISLDYNECGTVTPGTQICEGWLYDRKVYNNWTLIKVPIYYMNDIIPEKMNVIFSASNYPNFRANDGLYAGNSLYIDDAQLIYSSKIQQLIINNEEWKGFNPNATGVQTYVLKDGVETMPTIKAKRGAGQLTNKRGKTEVFRGRSLSSNEYTITPGVIDETPTLITVYAEDGSSQTTYQILFAHQASNNAQLSGIKVNGQTVKSFSPYSYNYTAEVEYGSTEAPVVTVIKQEDKQTVTFTQPSSINDVTTITVTAADGVTTKTYTVRYQEAQLSDNTLQNILVNGISIPDFSPNKTNYRVSIPLGTTQMPTVEAVSKYPDGMQTIVQTPPSVIDGGIYKISVTSPGNPSPKEYKLTFVLELSSYCKLKDIQLDGVSIDGFSPDVTSYSISLPLGTTSLPAITYTPGDSYQTISVELGELDGTTRIVVTAANGDTQVYKLLFTTAKSTISTLDGITLNGVMLPGFAPDVTNYTMQLPIGTTELPMIDVIKGDPYETVTIRTGGLNGVTRITVQAGNGNTTIYQITFSITQATDATLQAITIAGVNLPNFDPNRLEYSYSLPKGTTELPIIAYTPHDQYQTITTRSGGVNGDYKITVRPQSGASQTYVIHFSVPKSDNAQLQMIYLDGTPLPDFAPETLTYTDTLDNNTYPQVTYTPNDGQKIISYLDDNIHTIKVTAESGKSLTYTIQFVVRVSESAFLKMIYLDQKPLEGFLPEQLHYKNIYIAPNASPRITVDSDEGQQVSILSPASDGTAQIIVSANSGSHNTYLLELVDTTITPTPHLDPVEPYIPASDATLQTILADGVALPDFDADLDTYAITLPAGATVPAITFVPNDEKQSVAAGQIAHNLHQATVTAEDGTSRTYTVHIDCELYHNAYLLDLQVAGQQIQFQPETLAYHLTLDKGQALPEITYLAAPGQTVMMVAKDDATQQLVVTAQDGTTNTYVLSYTRVVSSNALLRDIVINGESLDGFDPNIFNYTYTLPFRAPYVPAVNAIEAIHGQTITTYHSAPKGITRIHVVAEDHVTSADYTIAFPTVLSSNTELANIELEAAYSVPEINFDPDQTEYTVLIPLAENKAPNIVFERAQKEQTVTLIARPIDQTSQVIVQAENGDERTYSISFQHDAAPVSNTLKSIIIAELDTAIDMSDPDQREWDIALPYGASSMTVLYEKNFNQQTVLVEPGGLYHPTRLTVLSNNSVQPTTIYTLHPQVNRQNPATLTGIQVDGTPIANFDRNRFNYIVDRANATTVPNIAVSHDLDVTYLPVTSLWSSTITVTSQGYTNTYHIFFHYPNEGIPNGEFSQWTKTNKSNTDKPASWNVPGDYLDTYAGTAKAGDAIHKADNSIVRFQTKYWGALYGAIPPVINLATMTANFAVAGGTTVTPSGTISFHNTPDQSIVNYKYPDMAGNGALFRFYFTDLVSTTTVDHWQTSKTSSYADYTIDLNTSGKSITGLDIIVDATGKYPKAPTGPLTDCASELDVDYIRFVYNNSLNGILVNGQATEREGDVF